MTTSPSIFRRTYDAVAIFSVLNMVVLGGVFAIMLGSGMLDGPRLRAVVEGLRNGPALKAEAVSMESQNSPSALESEEKPAIAAPRPTGDQSVAAMMNAEIMRREAERIESELQQRMAQVNNVLIRVTQEREAFKREKEQSDVQKETERNKQESEGFQKKVQIYETLSPKVAVELFLDTEEPDDAARILMQLDVRKAKKLVEAAKRPEQLEKIKDILARLSEAAPEVSAELSAN